MITSCDQQNCFDVVLLLTVLIIIFTSVLKRHRKVYVNIPFFFRLGFNMNLLFGTLITLLTLAITADKIVNRQFPFRSDNVVETERRTLNIAAWVGMLDVIIA